MKVEKDLRAEDLWRQCAEDEQVRHVVDMDEIKAAGQRAKSQEEKRAENERGILNDIGRGPAAVTPEGKAENVHSVESVTRRFVF
jgi:hypothetical protein